jgi:hypothetical protein
MRRRRDHRLIPKSVSAVPLFCISRIQATTRMLPAQDQRQQQHHLVLSAANGDESGVGIQLLIRFGRDRD